MYNMRAAAFSFFIFCLLLGSGAFLSQENASGVDTYSSRKSQPATDNGHVSYLQEGIICPEQNPLLLNNNIEQQLQEEERSCFKGKSAGKGEKSFRLSEAVSFYEALFKEHYGSFTGSVPIWLKVLSLRL